MSENCTYCGGTGRVDCPAAKYDDSITNPCPICQGKGTVDKAEPLDKDLIGVGRKPEAPSSLLEPPVEEEREEEEERNKDFTDKQINALVAKRILETDEEIDACNDGNIMLRVIAAMERKHRAQFYSDNDEMGCPRVFFWSRNFVKCGNCSWDPFYQPSRMPRQVALAALQLLGVRVSIPTECDQVEDFKSPPEFKLPDELGVN